MFSKNLPLIPALSQVNVVYTFLPYTFKIQFNIIPHLCQSLSKGFCFKVFWPKSCRYFWLLPCMLHGPPSKKVNGRENAAIFTHMSYNNLHVKSPELIFKFHRSDIKMCLLTCKLVQESPVRHRVVWCHLQPSLALSRVFPLLFLAEHFPLALWKAHRWQFNKVLHTVNLFVQKAIITFSQYSHTQSFTFAYRQKHFDPYRIIRSPGCCQKGRVSWTSCTPWIFVKDQNWKKMEISIISYCHVSDTKDRVWIGNWIYWPHAGQHCYWFTQFTVTPH